MKKSILLTILISLGFCLAGIPNANVFSFIEEGGIVIFTEGLTEPPIETEFNQRQGEILLVKIRIYKANASLVYTGEWNTSHIQINNFEAPPGQYVLEVEFNGEVKTTTFTH